MSSGVEDEDSPYTEQICKYCICQTEIIGMLQIMHIMLYVLIWEETTEFQCFKCKIGLCIHVINLYESVYYQYVKENIFNNVIAVHLCSYTYILFCFRNLFKLLKKRYMQYQEIVM